MHSNALVLLWPLLLPAAVLAQTAAPASDSTLSFNAGAVSDYRYRGISQSRLKPAVQGGVDYAHKSGLYVGAWASSIRWIQDAGGAANAELDVYGGYKFGAGPLALDVGVLTYTYPRHDLAVSPSTQEGYVAGTWGPATLKYSHAFSNLFGVADSRNSGYLDLSASFDLGRGWSLLPHVGHQEVRHNGALSYIDYALTVIKDFGNGVAASAAWVDTDTKAYLAPDGRNLGRGGLVLGVKSTF